VSSCGCFGGPVTCWPGSIKEALCIGGSNALHLAAESVEEQSIDVAKVLLSVLSNTEVYYSGGYTPMHAAAKRGHYKILEALIDAGANVL